MTIKIHHFNSLTKDEQNRLNGANGGWDSDPKFARYADITMGFSDRFTNQVHAAWELNEYHPVAVIDTDDLDVAFEKTNHITHDWRENKEVAEILDGRARSSSVGDIFEKDGKFFIVASCGFTEIKF
jgi:hypothetical protein